MHLLALIFISFSVNAIDANSIFYPLSSQTQGQFLTAKKLFMNENGGFWIQDVRNNIYFYDGQHVLKKAENNFGISTENLTYAEGDFWFSQGNKLFRMSPSGKREVILNLVNTESFKNVGYSNRHIWTFSSHYFHSYDLETSRRREYLLFLPVKSRRVLSMKTPRLNQRSLFTANGLLPLKVRYSHSVLMA